MYKMYKCHGGETVNTSALYPLTHEVVSERVKKWVEEIASEIGWWDTVLYNVKFGNEPRKERLQTRNFEYAYNKDIEFKETDIVVDIGSGPLPIYGNRLNGKELKYIPLDPLAYEYQKLYQKYDIQLPVPPAFAIMESLSVYVPHKADYVICNNAMDHSIDPLCALFECIKVVRLHGAVLLAHLESEAEHAHYNGLHQWNISNHDNELFFYNRDNSFNVSHLLQEFCTIELRRQDAGDGRWWNVVKIVKNREIEDEILLAHTSTFYMGMMISFLMQRLADDDSFYLPCGETRISDKQGVIVFGTGKVGIQVLSWFGKKKNRIKYFIDNAVSGSSTTWQGFQVKNPSLLEKTNHDIIIIASTAFSDEMQNQLVSMGFEHGIDFLLFEEFKKSCMEY